ncbi:WhiB family transcriptional regulator [Streptomyces longwoodensis]|uniref:WhiB family transcriptional regulator n=1 Tax=Streptomyces longwoodensis TaxID=68231 RepID=UPI0033D99EE2
MSSIPDFMAHGLCTQFDPELMFPHPNDVQGVSDAKSICAGCDVRTECLDYALSPSTRIGAGVAGGLTEEERNGLKPGRAHRYRVGRYPAPSQRHAPAA